MISVYFSTESLVVVVKLVFDDGHFIHYVLDTLMPRACGKPLTALTLLSPPDSADKTCREIFDGKWK